MHFNWEKVQSGLLAAATIAVAVALVHREFFNSGNTSPAIRKSESVSAWRDIAAAGRIVGDTGAPVKIIEFADLQCPFCREFNTRVKKVSAKYPGQVALVFVHFPITTIHPHALEAARAAECGAQQGRFAEMVDALYSDQASYGSSPWSKFGATARIGDSAAFGRCMADTTTMPVVQAGLATGKRFNVRMTPTVLVNDWRFGIPPEDSDLYKAIDKALAKKPKGRAR